MKKGQDKPAGAAELRRRAEARFKEKQSSQRSEVGDQSTAEETQRLVHELEVHQIQLEMQNEELLQARAEVEAILAQYTDLYDFAPVGYFTLERDGAIRRVNLTGARLLGVERSGLAEPALRAVRVRGVPPRLQRLPRQGICEPGQRDLRGRAPERGA